MTQPQRNLLSLWDYGWLDHNQFTLAPYSQPQELIEAYLGSDCFGTSFVGPSLDDTSIIHGPFWSSSIAANDFRLISSAELKIGYKVFDGRKGFRNRLATNNGERLRTL